ncbi:MAG: ceramidase domain-containing protein [Bacteroidota bacterium]
MPVKLSTKYALLFSITVIGMVLVFVNGPIPQSDNYHAFADTRKLYEVPNFWNVISNIPFVLIGSVGIFFILYSKKKKRNVSLRCSFVFFVGIFFTGIGSAYYHLYPSTQTLVWDRLPMTIAFMAFFSIVISEYICETSGNRLLFPLIMTGLLSILYWQMTESKGHGDLRLYVIVQFLPILLIPLILLLFKASGKSNTYFWMILGVYVLAKFFETFDHEVFHAGLNISGHTIKHLFAALAPLIFLKIMLKKDLSIHNR